MARNKRVNKTEEPEQKHANNTPPVTKEKKENQKEKKVPKEPSLLAKRIKIGLGFALLFLAVIFLIAFTSFILTGKYDQNILNTGINQLGETEIRNWLGKFGAVISQKFIGDWFGLAAFIFIPILVRLGIKVLFDISLFKSKDVLKYSLFTLLWFPPFMSFIASADSALFLGGGIGLTLVSYMSLAMGSAGTFLLLLFVLVVFVFINFNIQLDQVFPSKAPATVTHDDNEIEAKLDTLFDDLPPEGNAVIKDPLAAAQEVIATPTPEAETENTTTAEVSNTEEPNDMTLGVSAAQNPEVKEPIVVNITPIPKTDAASVAEESDSEPIKPEAPISLSAEAPAEEKPQPASEEMPLTVEITDKDPEFDLDSQPLENVEIEAVVGKEEETLNKSELKDLAKEFGEYDPTLDLSRYQKPPLDLLKDFGNSGIEVNRDELEANKNKIITTLKNYKIEISSISAIIGPTVTLYEIVPAAGVRISKIKNLEDDIALSLSALGIRIIAPIPGKGTIGIEVPNAKSEIVSMKAMLASDKFQNTDMILPVALGKTISNESFIADLAKMPHLLMAGATGQGKSVGLNAILVSLLYKLHPSQLKFVLVDPKKVELTLYNKIERHYLAKLPDAEDAIITDTQKVVATLNSLCIEMDQRYDLLKEAMTRNIAEYNQKFVERKLNPENGHRFLPYIVLVIDEFADLIMTAGKEVETPIARLAQLARAIGIHLIVATQRPSVNVITGIIKANFPARLAFRVTSKIDSRTILDAGGADQLIGRGDLLFSPGNELIRLQCPFVDTPEVERICDFIGEQQGYSDAFLLPEFVGEESSTQNNMDEEDRDALFDDAAKIVVIHQQGSASLLQRKLKLGYNRAGRIIDQLESAGIIGPFSGSKARDVLVPDEISLEQKLYGPK